jgi:carbonic anhydrase
LLKHDETNHYDHFEPLEFHGHWDQGGEATLSNNGFTGMPFSILGKDYSSPPNTKYNFIVDATIKILATLRFQNRELPVLIGGPLHEDQYVFEQLHFHWSDDDHSGCEHIFEGQA